MKSTFLERLLTYYHIDEKEYEELIAPSSLDTFSSGHSFKDIAKAVDIVDNAIKNNKRIVVYGDYDADGITGTSIIVKMFQKLNYQVKYYIPSRYIDGYGINMDNASKCVGTFDLVITVDNGIAANEAIQYLKDNNIEVVVIDHHTVQLPLPNADAIVHPSVSEYGDIPTSAGFCAFMFSKEMLGYYDKYLATLAAISVISDMMPLKEYNRKLVQAVTSNYIDNEFLPISLLAEHKPFNADLVGKVIAPKINSIARMKEDKTINYMVDYFVKDDNKFILTYLDVIINTNNERKELTRTSLETILENLDENALVSRVNDKEGLIGLVASGISSKLGKPAIVFCLDKDGNLKGSARSVEGFNIMDAFKSLEKYLLTYGGHALAGGCSIKVSDFDAFKESFITLVNNAKIEKKEPESIPFSLTEINEDNFLIYSSFAPFGEGWRKPLLEINGLKVDSLRYSKTGEHIITSIGQKAKIMGFYINETMLEDARYIDALGTLEVSYYKGNVTYEYHIESFKKVI